MAQFEANTTKMKQISNTEEQVSNQLKRIENELSGVINKLHMDTSAIDQVKRNLRANLQNVTTLQQRVHVLSTTLTQISNLYDTTEKSVAGSKVNRSKVTEAVSKVKSMLSSISDKIRQVEKALGIDNSGAYSSDPVNLCNGNYIYENEFLSINSMMEMRFRIFYNIQNYELGALGTGWTHSYEQRLYAHENYLDLQMDDGSRMNFFKHSDGKYYPLNGTIGSCEITEDGTEITDSLNFSYQFNKEGLIVSKKNIFGDKIDYIYNENHNIDHVQDDRGNAYYFSYNDLLQITEVKDHAGRKIQLSYKNGQLASVKNVEGRTVRYEYDQRKRLCKLINPKGQTALINAYDEQGRTVSQEFPDGGKMEYEYLDDIKQVRLTEQNGNQISYEHDDLFRNIRTIYEDGEERFTYDSDNNRTSYTDKRGNTSRYRYDANANLISYTSPLGDTTDYSYNDFNQVEKVSINGEMVHKAEYNASQRLAEKEDCLGGKEYYVYDEKGNPINWIASDGSNVEMTYDEYGNLLTITNAFGGKNSYEYDAHHNVIAETDALGNRTEFQYNEADELIRVKNAAGDVSSYEYDANGNVTRMTDFNGNTTSVEYNAMNKPVKVTDALGQSNEFAYDQMWNLVKHTTPDGGVFHFDFDPLHRLTHIVNPLGAEKYMKYDACNNPVEYTDTEGAVHKVGYDALNRPNHVEDPAGMTVDFEYDAQSNFTKVLFADGTCEQYSYDLLGNVTMSITPDGYRKYYHYDLAGNLLSVTDDDYCLEEYEFYPGRILKKEKFLDGSSREYIYDKNENLVQVINESGGAWNFTYDCLQRVVKAEDPSGAFEQYEYDAVGNILKVIKGEGEETNYHYNAVNRIDSVVDAFGNETKYTYDKCNRISSILQSENGRIDPKQLNRFNETQKGLRLTKFVRDLNGNITKQIDPVGQETDYSYDKEGRLISQLDADGNLTKITFNADGSQSAFQFQDGRSIRFSYNGLKQLVQMEDWIGTTKIDLDRAGHITGVTTPDDQHISYEWGIRGEQKSITYPDGKKVDYHYDDLLRLSAMTMGENTVTYDYFDSGKLKDKIYSNGFSSHYDYYESGNIRELTHQKENRIVDRMLYEYDRNNRKSRITRQRDAMDGSGVYDYKYNVLGSLAMVLHDGVEEEKYDYDAFGNRTSSRVFGKNSSYSYNILNQMTGKEDEEGSHEYAYDHRGNMILETLNHITKASYSFDAMNRMVKAEVGASSMSCQYDGFGNRVGKNVQKDGRTTRFSYLYNLMRDDGQILSMRENDITKNLLWDGTAVAYENRDSLTYFLNDERMTPQRLVNQNEIVASYQFDSFGGLQRFTGREDSAQGFTGFQMDRNSGLIHANAREYDPSSGRFLSMDPMPAMLITPITLNAYCYCSADPMNYHDPTGQIAAILGAGIVGAVMNVATKAAGDVVNSVKNGKITISSPQSYIGAATGGFVEGTVFVASGGNMAVASAAGSATETLVTNGLNMATGVEGYRKEDGYSWKNLVGDTAKSGVTGAITGATAGAFFGKAASKIKIPGINSGRGSFEAVWKACMTKAAKKQIANISTKTLMKGAVAYGLVKFTDKVVTGIAKIPKDYVKEKATDFAKNVINNIKNSNGKSVKDSITDAFRKTISGGKCPAGA